jgi:putative nucleotidyltransferase-like protein/transglutaminase superfamily protein
MPPNTPPPEAMALCRDLAASRGTITPSDFNGLALLLATHGLLGLAARATESGCLRSMSPGMEASVREAWLQARQWVAILDLESQRIAAAAAAEGNLRPPILIKGYHVARHYRDPTLRSYVDIDLLVPTDDRAHWGWLLEGLGFKGRGRWQTTDDERYSHHIAYRRSLGQRTILVELHACLWMERRVRQLDYRSLVPWTEPSPLSGLLAPTLGVQLVILAVHLLHHECAGWRLMWLHDFIELGTADAVAEAREIAGAVGVGWALEEALHAAEQLLGSPVWQASPGRQRFGLASVQRFDRPGLLHHIALSRELGPWRGARYLLSRFDPRRFTDPTRASATSARADVGEWVRKMTRVAWKTPWRTIWGGRRRAVTAAGLRATLLDRGRRHAIAGAALAYVPSSWELRRGAARAMAWATDVRPGPCRDIELSAWAVERLVRPGRLPGQCLLRSIVLARLLSPGRTQSVVIRLGVRRAPKDTIEAHAWVEVDGVPVTPAGDFPPLLPQSNPPEPD